MLVRLIKRFQLAAALCLIAALGNSQSYNPPAAVVITGLVKGNGASASSAYAGTSCTNQFPRSLDLNGTATCVTVGSGDLASSLSLTTPNINAATGTSLTLSQSSSTTVVDVTLKNTSTGAVSTKAVELDFRGFDTISTDKDGAAVIVTPLDNNWIGSTMALQTRNADVVATAATLGLGMQLGAPTGGDKGAGTLNLSNTTPIWVNGTASTGTGGMVQATSPTIATPLLSNLTTGTNADFLCLAAGGNVLIQASACTISSMRFKNLIGDYKADGALDTIGHLKPIVFKMKPGDKPNPDKNYARPQIGLSAENVAAIEPRCAIYEDDGRTPKSYRPECLIAVLVAGMQEQQREIAALKRR